jgi:hypothetical protein
MKYCIFPIVAFWLFPATALARFAETDDQLIDQEERYNTETWNDKYSYRYPVGWDSLYENADTAVRLHAGSLNISRFDYAEELKFSAANESAGFGFRQQRQEDVVEQVTVREVRMNGFFPAGIYLSMLADGGTYKEYGDIGWALGIGPVRRPWFELLYWSVDHFYDTKKSDELDKRSRQTWALTGRINADLTDRLAVSLIANFDHPLRWQRPSRGYTYDYERRSGAAVTSYRLTESDRLELDLSWDRKSEGKSWYDSGYGKRMTRDTSTAESKWIRVGGQSEQAAGVAWIRRRADYQHDVPAGTTDESQLPEPVGPDLALRREWVAFATWLQPLAGDRHYQQYGLFLNHVDLDDTRQVIATESKAQWAWEYRYTDKARVLLNTTWDVNQLTDDFPYDKRPFRPWGGGDIQFIAAF